MMLIKYLQLIHAFARAFFILWVKFPHYTREQKLYAIQHWSGQTLQARGVNVRLRSKTTSNTTTRLLVANHVSWLDVLVIQSLQPSVFIAKKEVGNWPVVGAIAKACGVVFVDRGSPSSAKRMVDDVSNALHHGYRVAGFPEGTSSEGHGVSLFHANIFEAAIHRQVDVQPIALRYVDIDTGALSTTAAFVGEMQFLESLHRIMSSQVITVDVQLGDAISPEGHSRRTLAHLSHRSVCQHLEKLANEKNDATEIQASNARPAITGSLVISKNNKATSGLVRAP
jgi:1-acyl-sn-glycerol-3-phosphate acyltransferase